MCYDHQLIYVLDLHATKTQLGKKRLLSLTNTPTRAIQLKEPHGATSNPFLRRPRVVDAQNYNKHLVLAVAVRRRGIFRNSVDFSKEGKFSRRHKN